MSGLSCFPAHIHGPTLLYLSGNHLIIDLVEVENLGTSEGEIVDVLTTAHGLDDLTIFSRYS